jgi:hypothetical protein
VGRNALYSNTTGTQNTGTGRAALYGNSTGVSNTATGYYALVFNSTGSYNTANGTFALYNNGAGNNNTATGYYTLVSNTADNNLADGAFALFANTTGTGNAAAGANALENNTTGSYNTAHGWRALRANVSGNFNAALGPNALKSNTANSNAAFGVNSLYNNTTGIGNIAMGFQAGLNLTTGHNNIDIGNFGVAGEGYTTRIGSVQNRTFIAGITGAVVSGGTAVYVNASGQLGTNPSSKRFKQDIAAMDEKSEAILALHPVTFRYKNDLDPSKTAQFGLIAEEVAGVDPDLVTRDDKGEVYSVRYEAVNAMLLNEFLKEHSKVSELQTALRRQQEQVTQQQKEIGELRTLKEQAAQQQQQIGELAAQIQRVSAQLALQKSVENDASIAAK